MKTLVFLAVCIFAVVVLAGPADAHPGGDTPSTDYATVVEGAPEGIEVESIDGGERLSMRVTGRTTVVVEGYGEALYRIGPDGAFENGNAGFSRSVNNGDIAPDGPKPLVVDPERWEKRSDRPQLAWRDARAFFNEDRRPRVDPSVTGVPTQWSIPTSAGEITGTVSYVEGPDPAAKVVVITSAFLVLALLGATRWWKTALVTALLGLVAADATHAIAVAARKDDLVDALGAFASGIYVVAGWAMGLLACHLLTRRDEDFDEPIFFAIFAAVVMGFFGGVADISDLTHSQIAVAGPAELTRWTVTLSCALGAGVLAICSIRLVSNRRRQAPNNSPMPVKV